MGTNIEKMKTIVKLFVRGEVRHHMIAVGAYYLAEQRGFQNGDPIGNWLASEKEVDQTLINIFLQFDLHQAIRRAWYSDVNDSINEPGKFHQKSETAIQEV